MGRNKSDGEGEKTVFFLLISASVLLILVMVAASGIRLRKGGFADYVTRSFENPGNSLRNRFDDDCAEYIPYRKIGDADLPVEFFIQNTDDGSCIYLCSGEHVSVYDSGGLNPSDADAVLQKHGTEEIEYLISIVSSAKHLSELNAIMEKYNIHNFIYGNSYYGNELGKSFIEILKSRGCDITELSSFMKLETENLRFELASSPDIFPYSQDIRFISENFKCLFTGDCCSENSTFSCYDESVSSDVTIVGCSETLRKIAGLAYRTDSGCILICPEKSFLSLSRKERRILRKSFEEVFIFQENSRVLICTDGDRYTVSLGSGP